MAQEVAEETDHQAGEARRVEQQAEENEHRDGQQDQRGHALVQAVGDHREIDVDGEDQVADRRKPETRRDRNAEADQRADEEEEEDQELDVRRQVLQRARRKVRPDREAADHRERQHGLAERGLLEHFHDRKDRHQRGADRQRRDAVDTGEVDRRNDIDRLFVRELHEGRHHDAEESRHDAERDGLDERPPRVGNHLDDGGHPHVLAAVQRDDRTQHREPQEQHRRDFVRPHQRRVEAVARDDAGEQHDHVRDGQRDAQPLDARRDPLFHFAENGCRAARRSFNIDRLRARSL